MVPRFLPALDKHRGHLRPFPFCTLAASISGRIQPQDGDELILPIQMQSSETCDNVFYERGTFATHFKARAMIARPLTHLSLRLTHEDWWNWGEDPNGPYRESRQLYLDPAVGKALGTLCSQPSVVNMEQLAAKRRAGEDVRGGCTWGAAVGELSDLKELKLVLETFDFKQNQLERVVECAKTWRFPLEDQTFELVWDGVVEEPSWNIELGELEKNYNAPSVIEGDAEEEDEGDKFTDEERYSENEYGSEEEDVDASGDEEVREPSPTPPPSWNRLCTRFEVRTVRFVRKSKGGNAS